MSRTDKTKVFDCIAFKREAQSRIFEDITGKTSQEQVEYFRNRAENGPLGAWWRSIKRRGGRVAPSGGEDGCP